MNSCPRPARKFAFLLVALSTVSAAAIPASAAAPQSVQSPSQSSAADELNEGTAAYRAARYDDAIGHFRKAVELDPSSVNAKLYLATALSQQVVPGLATPENLKTADESISLLQQVLEADPHQIASMKQVAAVYFSTKRLDDARTWQKRVLDEDPRDAEAAYTIGVIDWTVAHANAVKALAAAGLQDDGEGNAAAPAAVLQTIRQQNTPLVNEALHYLVLAVGLRPAYSDAMAYLNLVYRRRADLDQGEERADDLARAKTWAGKAMEARKANESEGQATQAPTQN